MTCSPRQAVNTPIPRLIATGFLAAMMFFAACGVRPPAIQKPTEMRPDNTQIPQKTVTDQNKPTGTLIEGPGVTVSADQPWGNAPDFTLDRFGGGSLTLSANRGKVIILDFWATWCPSCRQEIPDFVQIQKEYGDKGMTLIGVSLDRDGESAVRPYAEEVGINYPVVFGFDHSEITDSYGGIPNIPTTFIVDQKGDIVEKYVGYQSREVFETKIRELLGIIREEKP
jgi:cytochrome c biogenesis protein CcmG/thiol:disulfide interchange protein DsbE